MTPFVVILPSAVEFGSVLRFAAGFGLACFPPSYPPSPNTVVGNTSWGICIIFSCNWYQAVYLPLCVKSRGLTWLQCLSVLMYMFGAWREHGIVHQSRMLCLESCFLMQSYGRDVCDWDHSMQDPLLYVGNTVFQAVVVFGCGVCGMFSALSDTILLLFPAFWAALFQLLGRGTTLSYGLPGSVLSWGWMK